ncbi:hypothetical protein ASPZODRAFT_17856 [Penicilliopsis zonata CBS 506.65]|uniref:CFEM domain-containing protein n=1 Tax=Penicilliopsis zonata CBS 506.65 TaxID=1073090 RepID=A0A1L9SCS0_9EURO|nr:hypothetical protein ASPZODRAFT_17856 [Penicilliopsis zonata CBS 506.65]OJJ44944.1 hypothetical protein ASPZODRAFT_17856 [Penicilliopsis zonata CBS 506.65]
MQLTHAFIALVAAGITRAQIPNVPQCSLNCFLTALSTDGCSSLTDFACHCQKPSLVNSIAPCVQKACDVTGQSSVSSVVVSECSAAGHPISVPSVVGTASTTTLTVTAETTSCGSTAANTNTNSNPNTVSSTTTTSSSSTTQSTQVTSSSTHENSTLVPPHENTSSAPTSSTSESTTTHSTSPSHSSTTVLSNGAASMDKALAGVAAVAAAAIYVL